MSFSSKPPKTKDLLLRTILGRHPRTIFQISNRIDHLPNRNISQSETPLRIYRQRIIAPFSRIINLPEVQGSSNGRNIIPTPIKANVLSNYHCQRRRHRRYLACTRIKRPQDHRRTLVPSKRPEERHRSSSGGRSRRCRSSVPKAVCTLAANKRHRNIARMRDRHNRSSRVVY